MGIVIENCKVNFCSVTKPEGHKNGKHLIGVYVDKAFKKQFEKDFLSIWEENKTAKAKKPVYDVADWFSKDEDDSSKIIFWVNKAAASEFEIDFKQAPGCDFTEDDFSTIGTNSVIDLEYDLYYYNHPTYGEMVLRSIKGICLKELVPYEGGSNLEGESIKKKKSEKSEKVEEQKPKKDKKNKKDKKKKKSED